MGFYRAVALLCRPSAAPSVHDTALAAHEEITENHRDDAINAVVFLTDGKNEDTNGIALDTLLESISTEDGEQGVRIFTIGYGDDSDMETMTQISEATNAAAYDASDPESIDEIFEAVISNF